MTDNHGKQVQVMSVSVCICDMIKGNELDVSNIDFELQV